MSHKHITKASLIDKCLTQSNAYLNYIIEKLDDGGKIYDEIEAIEYDKSAKNYSILLEKKIFDFDRVYFELKDKEFILDIDKDIFIKDYNEDSKSLIVTIKHKDIKPSDITKESLLIVSDLTFLIQNIFDWYQNRGKTLTFKAKALNLQPDINILKDIVPDKDQVEAIESIFQNAYSYIWGPPGTGKTKVVLSNSVINLLYEGKRVLIVAPTNIAIDQAMQGLIYNTDLLGLNRSDFFRFAQASHKYQSLYPQTCLIYENNKSVDLFSIDDDKKETNYKKIMIKRLNQSKVVSMTLDTYIALSLSMELEFDHIFCDEIGYASLIKIIPLFSLKVPITFLGDHMQLPPISEASKIQEQTSLFSQNGVMIESLINTKFLKRSSLKTTHRFGANLSNVLNHYIYQNGFKSYDGVESEIFYINSKSNPDDAKGRFSIQEIEKIKKYLRDAKFSTDVAILTPYNAQSFRLKKSLPNLYSDKIMTVHKSQGSEFETVIFSIVDDSTHGKRGAFFTDSTNFHSNGLNLINTVVSRTKKRLILVGNHYFWKNQNNQLISALFKIAKEIK